MSAANGLLMGEVNATLLYTFGANGLQGVPVAVEVHTMTLALGMTCPVPPFATVPETT